MRARKTHRLSDFDFDLPSELIAQAPAPRAFGEPPAAGRGRATTDLAFAALPRAPGARRPAGVQRHPRDQVAPGRRQAQRRQGRAAARAHRRAARGAGAAAREPPAATRRQRRSARRRVGYCVRARRALLPAAFRRSAPLADYLERHGEVPLPPYIARAPDAADEARYQTVYARHAGRGGGADRGPAFRRAAARRDCAPAASRFAYVTLHVGAGTFQPVETDDLSQHRMHSERYQIPPATVGRHRRSPPRGGRAWSPSARRRCARSKPPPRATATSAAGEAETDLFITPGFRFRVVDRLLTNFHLPRSTLLMLVSAFAGLDAIRAAYAHAIARALPLFQLRRCDAARARSGSRRLGTRHRCDSLACYNRRDAILGQRALRQRAPRAARARARRRRNAGVHAGRHLRHGQGDGAERARRNRRADRARQHLPPVAAPGHRGHRRARRPASLHGLGPADPHRLRRLPGVQPRARCARSARTASRSPRRSTATGCC